MILPLQFHIAFICISIQLEFIENILYFHITIFRNSQFIYIHIYYIIFYVNTTTATIPVFKPHKLHI